MKTTKTTSPKRTSARKKVGAVKAAKTVPQGKELGLKEQVKRGTLTAKDAMAKLAKKGNDALQSNTYRWLTNRADQEAAVEAKAGKARK